MRAAFAWSAAFVFLLMASGCRQPADPGTSGARDSDGEIVVDRGGAEPCLAEPLDAFDASLPTPMSETTLAFGGTLEGVDPVDADGRVAYRFRAGEAVQRLLIRGATLPVRVGDAYQVRVDRVGGSPSASGLLIRDAAGALVFAGASDQNLGGHVLTDGVPGFTLALGEATCASRGAGECFRAAINRALTVRHGDAEASLHHGDTARLGDYEVRCLVAQRVEYARCPDFAFHAVSFTVARAAAPR